MNMMKTTLLLGALTGLMVLVGDAIGGRQGMVMALGFAGLMNFVSYFFSDKIVLATYGAKPVSAAEAPELYGIVERLALKANIPVPKVYVIPDPSPNAFATGRNPSHAAVAVTEGILKILSREELEGVLAHELSHVLNRDILISSVAATLAGAITMLARMAYFIPMGSSRDDNREGGSNPLVLLLSLFLAPIAALLIQMAVSRSREYGADDTGAHLVGYPNGLIGALRKLQEAQGRLPLRGATPATAHLFIVNPFSGRSLMNLFSTHPPLEERIARLQHMNG
jgi:heat shock protein HtpX